jgi:hypothetical protein
VVVASRRHAYEVTPTVVPEGQKEFQQYRAGASNAAPAHANPS